MLSVFPSQASAPEFYVLEQDAPILQSSQLPRFCFGCEDTLPGMSFLEADGSFSDTCSTCRSAREMASELDRLDREQESVERKVRFYQQYAEGRGFPWLLSDEEAVMLFQQPCVFCGDSSRRNCIARLDTRLKMYRLDNSVSACPICNLIRLDYSMTDFVHICRTIASHRGLVSERWRYPEAFRNSPTVKTYKVYANATNRVMMLDKPTFDVMLLGDCFYCGKRNEPGIHQNGIDRIDSQNRKYEIGNVVTCCRTCNSLKWNLPQNRFLQHVTNVAHYCDLTRPVTTFSVGEASVDPIILY